MKVKELTDWLGGNFPAAVAEDWDNVGLLTFAQLTVSSGNAFASLSFISSIKIYSVP